jgi:uncharacterized repeat protein (TIGR03803 family)
MTMNIPFKAATLPSQAGRVMMAVALSGAAVVFAQGITVSPVYSYADNFSPRRPVEGKNGKFYAITGGGLLVMTPTGYVSIAPITGGISSGSSLVEGNDGNFYGTTSDGGSSYSGTVFRITPKGAGTTIHTFTGINPEGSQPNGRVIKGSDGNFYGTTYFGGASSGVVSGTVFKVTPSGTLTTLYSFTGSPNGANPVAPLIQGSNGNFYGTTYSGGFSPLGTVFSVSSTGSYSLLSNFSSYGTVGSWANPTGPVTEATDGNFYGTTPYGPDISSGEDGSVFRVTPGGVMTVMHQFDGTDGSRPSGALLQAKDGYLYGTTPNGGASGYGTIFRMTLSGDFTTLYSFTGGTRGGIPGSLMLAKDGQFYVTTSVGGKWGYGALVRISTAPAAPEIVVEQPLGGDLKDGLAKKSFGTVRVGKQGKARTFTIRNNGSANLTSLSIRKSGANPKDFVVTAPVKSTLVPGEQTTFKVYFAPRSKGKRNAAIQLKSNDSNENPFNIELTGSGEVR